MSILIVGVNHKTAPVSIREKVSFSPDSLPQALHAAHQVASECLILSTCNRTELYAACQPHQSVETLAAWLAEWHNIPLANCNRTCKSTSKTPQYVMRYVSPADWIHWYWVSHKFWVN